MSKEKALIMNRQSVDRALTRIAHEIVELWFVEGLSGGRFALITKVHHCMIDGVSGVDLIGLLMDPAVEADARRIEARRPVDKPLDVLTQHLVTIAVGEGFVEADLKAEVMSTRAYRDLTDAEWRWALDFVVRGGESLKAYPEYRRVEEIDGLHVVRDEAIARRHRMSVGTIVADASIDVRYQNGKRLGHVEESFEKLKYDPE